MTEHPDLLLSAYLDDALPSDERSTVRAHAESCDRCRARLADLRATIRLIGALPTLVPTRSLLPRVERGRVWLRPVRLLGSMGTGAFLFLFLASAILNSGSSLGGGASTSERLAEKGQFGAAANALASESAQRAAGAPTPAAAAGAARSARAPSAAAVPAPRPEDEEQDQPYDAGHREGRPEPAGVPRAPLACARPFGPSPLTARRGDDLGGCLRHPP